jgi:hypothetical protein
MSNNPVRSEKQAATATPQRALRDLCREALWQTTPLEHDDAAAFADWVIDEAIALLRRHPQMPRLPHYQWELLFANLREKAEHELAELIDDAVDPHELIENILQSKEEEEEETA